MERIAKFFTDGRGAHSTALKNKNRATIKKWIEKNPGETMTRCMNETGLSYPTIMNHLKEMREEAE
jgi:predicted transcriptional regulator